ncbi:MAG: deoxyhypusine synthase [Haloarculaceae archaeon]
MTEDDGAEEAVDDGAEAAADEGSVEGAPAKTGELGTRPESEGAERSREEFAPNPVAHAEARAGMTVGELAAGYGDAGFGANAMAEAVDIYTEMLERDDVTNFLGLAGAMVPAGMRRIVADLVRDGHVDALVTTGATLTHDAIEAIGGKHHHGRHDAPELSRREHDETLRAEGVDRIYDVYLPQEHFSHFETHLRENVFPALEATASDEAGGTASTASTATGGGGDPGPISIQRLTAELGRANAAANETARERGESDAGAGIAAAAWQHDVPVYCPAIQDSVLGLQTWMYGQTSDLALDALAGVGGLTDIAFEAEEAGALVVGGGVPKNFVLQTMLVTPGAYDYAVQLTMDPETTGGLSGASLEEARSWGKLETDARNASVYADATITLPLLVAAARERIGE